MDICRLCLNNNEELVDVLSVDNLCADIKNCVSLEIIPEDNLPKTACVTCIQKVRDWCEFKFTCLLSQESLLQKTRCKNLFYEQETVRDTHKEKKSDDDVRADPHDLINELESNAEFGGFIDEEEDDEDDNGDEEVNDDDKSEFDCSEELELKDFLESTNHKTLAGNTYVCDICAAQFDCCMEYLDHQEQHDGQPVFKCSKCPEVYSKRQDLVAHDSNHKTTCPYCGIVILKSSMKLHLIKHTDRHVCPDCSNHFHSKATLQQHVITMHTNIKNHVCESCGKRFSSLTAMRVHLRSHSEIREYKCRVCKYAGKTASALYVHMATHEKNTCVCEVCSKIFKSNRNLYDHLRRVHSVEKKHSCSHCSKRFVDKYMLTVHLRSHTGFRPYRCPVCNKGFNRSDGLKEHAVIHGTREKHECKACGKKFSSKRGVSRHSCSGRVVAECKMEEG